MRPIILLFLILFTQFSFAQKKNTSVKKSEKIEKTTEEKLQLSAEQIKLYNPNFEKFIEALKISDRPSMESLLGSKAKQMVTEEVFTKLSKDINLSRKLTIYKTGYKSTIGGKNYPMIQYKYSDDKAKEPKEIITAVFEEDGKILGIKPYRQSSI
jgi:hypothetical protein